MVQHLQDCLFFLVLHAPHMVQPVQFFLFVPEVLVVLVVLWLYLFQDLVLSDQLMAKWKKIAFLIVEATVCRCSKKQVFLKNFGEYIGKHLCRSHFSNVVTVHRPATLLKKKQVFSWEFSKFFRNTFLIEHLRWLLLYLY